MRNAEFGTNKERRSSECGSKSEPAHRAPRTAPAHRAPVVPNYFRIPNSAFRFSSELRVPHSAFLPSATPGRTRRALRPRSAHRTTRSARRSVSTSALRPSRRTLPSASTTTRSISGTMSGRWWVTRMRLVPCCGQPAQARREVAARAQVERVGRLVEDERLRTVRQGPRDEQPARLARRQLVHAAIGEVLDLHQARARRAPWPRAPASPRGAARARRCRRTPTARARAR